MNITVPRALSITTNPAGWLAAIGAVFAAATMVVNAVNHHGVIDTSVIVAAVGMVAALLTRQVVTPVTDPKDGAGTPLVPVSNLPLGTYSSGNATVTPVKPPKVTAPAPPTPAP